MNRLKVAIVGCGKVARKHLKAINFFNKQRKNTDFILELTALVDPQKEAADKLVKAYNGVNKVQLFLDMPSLFVHQKPDIVAITTPSGMHYEQAKLALENNCHVFIEKPITLKEADALDLLDLAGSRKLKVAVGHIYRYFPLVGLLEQDIQKGKFGKALFGNVQVRWGHDQAYYDQAAWRGTREFDGGAIMNQSIHALDLMHMLLGQAEFLRVKGAITKQIHDMESEDLGFGIFELEDNTWFALEGTTNTDPARPEASFFVKYTEGEIRASLIAGKISFSIIKNGKELKRKYLKLEIINRIKSKGLAYLKQMANPHTGIYLDLAESILYNSRILADGESGLRALQMVLALYQDAGVK